MLSQETVIKPGTPVKVILKEDTEELDEVVVIGYGTVKKRDLTGSMTSIKQADIVAVPTIDHGNSLAHTFGLGAMGLHSYLAQQLIEYGSPESVEFTSIYFMLMNYWTLVESNNIARERGVTFHNFENQY